MAKVILAGRSGFIGRMLAEHFTNKMDAGDRNLAA